MTWEEIIIQIRSKPEYRELVELSYFEDDLVLNVERFRNSEEFIETLKILKDNCPAGKILKLADIGAGNGVASIAFALEGFEVCSIEPDPSMTVGAGAIRKLKSKLHIDNLQVVEAWGESLPLNSCAFDVVYIRQAMHHAADLIKFVKEAARLILDQGVLLTVRDHVIYNEEDKQWFLRSHPLHQFYGGENAYTKEQYVEALTEAGLKIHRCYQHFDSVINYFPERKAVIEKKKLERKNFIEENFIKTIPYPFNRSKRLLKLYSKRAENKLGPVFDERKIPGRMISFISKKSR